MDLDKLLNEEGKEAMISSIRAGIRGYTIDKGGEVSFEVEAAWGTINILAEDNADLFATRIENELGLPLMSFVWVKDMPTKGMYWIASATSLRDAVNDYRNSGAAIGALLRFHIKRGKRLFFFNKTEISVTNA